MEEGGFLGEEEIIYQNKRKFSLKAATDVNLMVLYKEDFENLFEKEDPYIYRKILKITKERKIVL